jgi:uncharacterized Ntn-hydrolase superfamily protein
MTFSVVARCPATGAFGVAVTSSSPAVAARCAHVRAGVGAAATQNVTDPRLGPALLDALAGGDGAERALAAVRGSAPFAEHRQLVAVDASGEAAWSGSGTLGIHGSVRGAGVVVAGNLLAGTNVLDAALGAFEASTASPLEARLLACLAAGLAAGGEQGPLHSAGLLVCEDVPWPVTDLRVDWSDQPVADLAALWRRWEPQKADYVVRALDPTSAPGYGVPGDAR